MTKQTEAQTPGGNPKYLSYSGAAWYTGLSVATLRRRAEEGKLKVIRHGGRIIIERSALDFMLHAGNEVKDKEGDRDDKE